MPSDFAITPIREKSQPDATASAGPQLGASTQVSTQPSVQPSAQPAGASSNDAQSTGTSAPSANLNTAPVVHMNARLGIAVVELQDQRGNIILSMPSQKAISAYLAGVETALNPNAIGGGGQTNTTA